MEHVFILKSHARLVHRNLIIIDMCLNIIVIIRIFILFFDENLEIFFFLNVTSFNFVYVF